METEEFFFAGSANCLSFKVNSDKSFLPFPISQDLFWRLLVSALLVAIFIQGCKKRLLIAAYLRSPEIQLNPSNVFFSLEQVNGVFLALGILFRISFNVLPVPLSDLADPRVCVFAELMSGFYISGTIVWRCYMAIFKLLCVKGHKWVKNRVRRFPVMEVAIGLSKMVLFSIVIIKGDKDNHVRRSCYHKLTDDLELLYGLEVRLS